MNSFIAALRDLLWEEAHARNFNNRYYHHREKCGKMEQQDRNGGFGNNTYTIRQWRCLKHNVLVCEGGWEFGLCLGTVSKSLNPPKR